MRLKSRTRWVLSSWFFVLGSLFFALPHGAEWARRIFESLRVYQLAEKLADRVWKIVIKWDHFSKVTVGYQMVDAADGVGANIAEGTGRGSLPDNRRFVKIARGSLYETKHWLRRAYKRKLLTDQDVHDLKPLIDELLPSLNAYFRSLNDAIEKTRTKNKVQSTKVTI